MTEAMGKVFHTIRPGERVFIIGGEGAVASARVTSVRTEHHFQVEVSSILEGAAHQTEPERLARLLTRHR